MQSIDDLLFHGRDFRYPSEVRSSDRIAFAGDRCEESAIAFDLRRERLFELAKKHRGRVDGQNAVFARGLVH